MRIAVLASTKGTDLQAIIDELKAGKMPGIELAVVISNRAKAYVLERASTQGFPAIFIDPKNKTPEQFDTELAATLAEHKVDLVILIGYMRILTPGFVQKFPQKIINVHPSLMPKFSGPGFMHTSVHEAVIQAGEKETGCTFHYVDEGLDTGEIILQKSLSVEPNDTPETLKAKVQKLEGKWYPEVIRQFAAGRIG